MLEELRKEQLWAAENHCPFWKRNSNFSGTGMKRKKHLHLVEFVRCTSVTHADRFESPPSGEHSSRALVAIVETVTLTKAASSSSS